MRPDHLTNLCKGDTVTNCFSEPLVVVKTDLNNNNVLVVNTGLESQVYSCNDLYLEDMQEESDEEIYWVRWATQNRDYVKTQHIDVIKYVYQQGFANGFTYQRICRADEQLQK